MKALPQALRRVASFATIGAINTGIYASICYGGVAYAQMTAGLSAAIGYLCGAVFSYFANAALTFGGQASHRQAAPRFFIANGITFLIGVAVPALAVDVMGLPVGPSVAAASLIVPPCNYLLMSRFVFAPGEARFRGI